MKKIFFIGRFPPPYGGATIKSEMLYKMLLKNFNVEKFDTESKNDSKIKFLLKLLIFLFNNRKNNGVICIATESLFKFTKYINSLFEGMLGNISVFAIGGELDELIKEYKMNIEILKKYKVIYVECSGIKEKLNYLGLHNVEVVPNCRTKPIKRKYVHNNSNKELKCLFISRIDKNKGIFKIIDCFKEDISKDITVDFYGPIDEDIYNDFYMEVNNNPLISYKGIIESNKIDIYSIIKEYDLLLFPTEYKEGYPGIISEAKIAGIPIITSNFRYSKEIIENYKDGIILEENTKEELYNLINKLNQDRELLTSIRYNSFLSGEKCFIEFYMDKIIEKLDN